MKQLFQNYFVVQIFTDVVPANFYNAEQQAKFGGSVERQTADARQVNFKFMDDVFKTKQLPLYVVLEPQLDESIDVIAIYPEGRINNENAFAEFLRNPK